MADGWAKALHMDHSGQHDLALPVLMRWLHFGLAPTLFFILIY